MLDVGGVSLGILKIMPLFKAVNSVGSSYFPERTVHILVLNAPRVFASLWSIVRCAGRLRPARRVRGSRGHALPGQLQKLVDPRTQKKVVILSGGDKQFNGARLPLPGVRAASTPDRTERRSASHIHGGPGHTAGVRGRACAAPHERPGHGGDGIHVRLAAKVTHLAVTDRCCAALADTRAWTSGSHSAAPRKRRLLPSRLMCCRHLRLRHRARARRLTPASRAHNIRSRRVRRRKPARRARMRPGRRRRRGLRPASWRGGLAASCRR